MPTNNLLVTPPVAADGTNPVQGGERLGSALVSETRARYGYAAAAARMGFSYTAARATSLAATAMIGNIVWNPPDSGVNLELSKWSIAVIATSATCTGFALAVGYQTTTPTSVTASDATGLTRLTQPALGVAKAKGYAIATVLIAPVNVYLLAHNTAAIAATGIDTINGDLEGLFVIPPGGFAAITALGAAAAASGVNSSLTWMEVPV